MGLLELLKRFHSRDDHLFLQACQLWSSLTMLYVLDHVVLLWPISFNPSMDGARSGLALQQEWTVREWGWFGGSGGRSQRGLAHRRASGRIPARHWSIHRGVSLPNDLHHLKVLLLLLTMDFLFLIIQLISLSIIPK